MKRSKLLLMPILATCAIAPVAMLTSCNQKSEAELTAEAIYKPLETTKTIITDSYIDHLKSYSASDRKNALIYDLFGLFNKKKWRNLPANESFTSLYKKQIVSIASNITKCDYEITSDNQMKVNMLGYVSFVFTTDLSVEGTTYYRANDYVMITYDIQNRIVTIDETNCSIKYEPDDKSETSTECIGIIKEVRNGSSSKLYALKDVDTYRDYKKVDSSLPTNFKNLAKN